MHGGESAPKIDLTRSSGIRGRRARPCRLVPLTSLGIRCTYLILLIGNDIMMKPVFACLVSFCRLSGFVAAGEANLVRYPDYHAGKITFAYLGDIWTADEDGNHTERLTVHTARDVYPKFSP